MKKIDWENGVNAFARRYGIYITFAVLMLACSLMSPYFLTTKNMLSVLRQLSITGILAFAEMFLIISGSIDLSLGSVVALSGMISVGAYLATDSFLVAFAAAMLAAVVCCTVSGFLVAKIRLPAFIATMAMDSIARGSVYMYSKGQPIYQIGDYGAVSSGFLGSIPIPVVFFAAIALVSWVILSRTTLGRDVYAVGGNPDAANASGISVSGTIIKTFVITGIFTGIAAVLQMARVNSGLPDTAMNYHGDAIAATVIGGTSFTGGIGTAPGTFVGSIIMGMIGNILNLTGVQSYAQNVVKGMIIIGAVSLDLLSKNRRVKKKSA